MTSPHRKKTGPKGKGPRRQLTVRLPVGLRDRLEALSLAREEPMGEIVVELVDAHIDELEGNSGLSPQEELDLDFRARA